MGRVIRYVSQEKKTMDETGRRYLSGINCTPELAQKSFMATKNLYGKASGTFFYQYVQSFSPEPSSTSTSSPSPPKRKSRLRKRTKSLKNWRSGSSQAARFWWPHTWTRSTCTPT